MDAEVEATNFFFADAFSKQHDQARRTSSLAASDASAPSLSYANTSALGRTVSCRVIRREYSNHRPRPSFDQRLSTRLAILQSQENFIVNDDVFVEDEMSDDRKAALVEQEVFKAWQVEACATDQSVRILPGVKKVMDTIPQGRSAVATYGARTYGELPLKYSAVLHHHLSFPEYDCITRVGGDKQRLKVRKPAPNRFVLAASGLRFDAERCVVVEESPSGIRAGVASGATVIAVCTTRGRRSRKAVGRIHCGHDGAGADRT